MSALIAYIRADATLDTPQIPGAWERTLESNRWSTIYPAGRADGRFFHARLVVRGSPTTRAVFVCTGPPAVLSFLAAQITADGLSFTQTWASLAVLRADAGTLAGQIKAAWPDERPLVNTGTVGSPIWTPTGTRVAHFARMAGADSEDAE